MFSVFEYIYIYIFVDSQRMSDTSPPVIPLSPDVDFVQDTQVQDEGDTGAGSSQPKKGRRVHRKKGPDEPKMKNKQLPWTPSEQMSLCKAWLEVTEDPLCGNV